VDRLTVTEKGRNDFVTQVDQEAEDEIVRILRAAYPDHAIQAEESGRHAGNDYEWIIDPLDGTTNFLHGHPQFAVSIALRHRGQLDQAVVFDPLRDELFCASRGGGASLNNRRIRVSGVSHLRDALLGTGFPFKSLGRLEEWITGFRLLLVRSSGVRRAGSAALDLAYVACGRLDGFWELGLKPWDMAAGCLLIQEAGGLASDLQGGRQYLATGDIVAGNPDIHAAMLEVLHSGRS
jgi:myo-inositol-1(or 4)-monophosphatase